MSPKKIAALRPVAPSAPALDDQRACVIAALENLKANDIREIDVRGKTSITDLLIVASGTSTRHVKSIADEVVRRLKELGVPPMGVEGEREGEWVLVDVGDIVVHVMLPRVREFYGLERLWGVAAETRQAAALAADGGQAAAS